MAPISISQWAAKVIYRRLAGNKITRKLMSHTAKEGTRLSNLLNRALGTKDALDRLHLFGVDERAYQIARNYVDKKFERTLKNIDPIYAMASAVTDDYGSALALAIMARGLIKETGYDAPPLITIRKVPFSGKGTVWMSMLPIPVVKPDLSVYTLDIKSCLEKEIAILSSITKKRDPDPKV